MSNYVQETSRQVHNRNPMHLVEKTIRERILESTYWNESCFAVNAADLIDLAVALDHIGGTFANTRPTPFLCLLLKLLQIGPRKEIVIEYLQVPEFKYMRALAAFYVRMTFRSLEVYELLEPMLMDLRKLRERTRESWELTHMDTFIDQLLTEDRVCDLILPRLTQRHIFESSGALAPYQSPLHDQIMPTLAGSQADMDQDEEETEAEREERERRKRMRYISTSRSPSPRSRSRSGSRARSRSHSPREYTRYISRSPSASPGPEEIKGRYISRSPTASPPPLAAAERYISRSPTASPPPT